MRAAPMVCPEESLLVRPQAHSPASLVRRLPEGVQGASGKPPACSNNRQLCRKKFPLAGLDAPTPAPEEGLQPSWGTHLLRRRSEGGAGGRAESPPAGMTRDNFAVSKSPWWGLTRRLRREGRACSPMGRSHFSFGGERKVCKRKPAARRLREKALYCPFWRRGSLCRAQHSWPAYAYSRARSELAFFRRQNGRAFFPPLPIAALLPRSWRRAGLPLAE